VSLLWRAWSLPEAGERGHSTISGSDSSVGGPLRNRRCLIHCHLRLVGPRIRSPEEAQVYYKSLLLRDEEEIL
jgi:hypothetical protein